MAIIVNASGEYLRRTANLPSDSAFTAMCWMYLNSIRSGVFQYVIELADSESFAYNYNVIGFNSVGVFQINQGLSQNFGSSPSAGNWYHVFLRNNGTTLSGGFRAAGSLSYSTASRSSGSAFTEAALYFGNDSYNRYMDCILAGIKVWDAHLTDEEIEKEFWKLRPERTADLNIWTPGILAGTDRVKDYSGNGRDWTAGGTLTDGDGPPVPWGAGLIIILPVSGSAAQYLAPVSDVAAGSWTPSTGSDLYAMLDETSYSDTDYIAATSATTCTLALGSGSDPSSSTGHILRYRLLSGSGTVAVTLKQGTTTIASWGPHTLTLAAQDFAQTLTGGEADSITDYSALRVEFTSALA